MKLLAIKAEIDFLADTEALFMKGVEEHHRVKRRLECTLSLTAFVMIIFRSIDDSIRGSDRFYSFHF
jgi:hypothetical protein